jgi:pyridoxal phosphate enzyme (YggS family)
LRKVPDYMSSIADNLARVEQRISAAAQRAGRSRREITLIGVSKTHPGDAICEAHEAGLRHFGENRVQEWEGKRGSVMSLPGAVWHLIGHLQSNKATRAAQLFHCVDSVDDLQLIERLQRARTEARPEPRIEPAPTESVEDRKLRLLLEVRIANEETKSGAEIAELPALAERVMALESLHLAGLMCIPPFCAEAERARPYFRRLREVRDALEEQLSWPLPVLSMGMSHDFEVAIAEGATEIRVGTALFGAREITK